MIKRGMDSFLSDRKQLQELAKFILAELGENPAGQAQSFMPDYSERSGRRLPQGKTVPTLKRRKYQKASDSMENFDMQKAYEEQIGESEGFESYFDGELRPQGKTRKISLEAGGDLIKPGSSAEETLGAAVPSTAVLSRRLSDFCCRDARRYDCGFERY